MNKGLTSPPLSSPLAAGLAGRARKMQSGIIGRLGWEEVSGAGWAASERGRPRRAVKRRLREMKATSQGKHRNRGNSVGLKRALTRGAEGRETGTTQGQAPAALWVIKSMPVHAVHRPNQHPLSWIPFHQFTQSTARLGGGLYINYTESWVSKNKVLKRNWTLKLF